jgi:photoactive yellow protein
METGQDFSATTIPFGLFELDPKGIVIRYSPASEKTPKLPVTEILGRNFFTEIAPVKQVIEFRERFQVFMARGQSIDKFSTRFTQQQQHIKVQIMMAHLAEEPEDGRRRLALVRIMSD